MSLSVAVALLACGGPERVREPSPESARSARTLPPESATVALDALSGYAAFVREMANAGVGADSIPVLEQMSASADAQLSEHAIDAAFRDRYRQLVAITIAVLTPITDDNRARINAQLATFDPNLDWSGGLAEIVPALIEEIVGLHLLIEPDMSRDHLQTMYTETVSGS